MASLHVAAHSAAINGAVAHNPKIFRNKTKKATRTSDRFSVLLTSLAVAHAQQRRFEAARHEPMLRHAAKVAWTTVTFRAERLIRSAGAGKEDRAIVGFALVIEKLASLRGTPQGLAFHRSLMRDPGDLLSLFQHARSHRSDMLMSACFNLIDRLAALQAFGARPFSPEPSFSAA